MSAQDACVRPRETDRILRMPVSGESALGCG